MESTSTYNNTFYRFDKFIIGRELNNYNEISNAQILGVCFQHDKVSLFSAPKTQETESKMVAYEHVTVNQVQMKCGFI